MKCIFCNNAVYGHDGITVPRKGPAHQKCYQTDQVLRRTFQHLDITALNDQEIQELKELIIAEENSRSRTDEEDAVELF